MTARYGLLTYDPPNLGDEIQSLAARRFLPRIDCLLPRENLPADPGGETAIRTILNGWFLHRPRRWPPHEKIQPLLISLHLNPYRPTRWRPQRTAAKVVLARGNRAWLRRHGPVGARDANTLRLLRDAGIESYYSGCLTLTLPRRDPAVAGDRVVACGLTAPLVAALARRTRHPPVVVDHLDTETQGFTARMARAQALLDLYAGAKAVVTSRVHCALPCLALGTPVLFVPLQPDLLRQAPALELAHHQTAAELLAGRGSFDPEAPPPNPDHYRALVPDLIRRCEAFVRD